MYEQDVNLNCCQVFTEIYHVGIGNCFDQIEQKFFDKCNVWFGWSKIFDFTERTYSHKKNY